MTDAVVVADWGTSSFRAWSVAGNSVNELVRIQVGVKDIPTPPEKTQFLQDALAPFLGGIGAVEGIGMISSTLGIMQTPYQTVPASLASLLAQRVDSGIFLENGMGEKIPLRLGPGVSFERDETREIMRGEELQVLSATTNGLAICPGSHSKWVNVSDSTIVSFSTFLTGELYSSLSSHTSLLEAIGDSDDESEEWESGFATGLDQSPETFSRELFAVRARWVKDGNDQWATGYLSGLCVGLEWNLGLRTYAPQKVDLIGSDTTVRLYERAASHFGVTHQSHPDSVAPHVFLHTSGGNT